MFVSAPALLAQNGRAAAPPPSRRTTISAAQWTAQKVSRLVFDTSVTPRWLETSDRFWYAYQTREGRRFYIVDPLKRAKAPLFDHAKMAAALTSITRIPYDAQNLPFSTVRFVKKDAAFEFNFQVPATPTINTTKPREITTEQRRRGQERRANRNDERPPQSGAAGRPRGPPGGAAAAPPRNKTLYFEYDMATARVTLLEDYKAETRQPRWASLSPDGKTVVFSRNHNLT